MKRVIEQYLLRNSKKIIDEIYNAYNDTSIAYKISLMYICFKKGEMEITPYIYDLLIEYNEKKRGNI